MSNDANKLTPAQALTVIRQIITHPQLRFLNVEEAHVAITCLSILDNVVNPKPEAPLTIVPEIPTV